MHIIIGITFTESQYQNYPLWIKGDNSSIEIIQLTPENVNDLEKCNGIVLSGGIDTHPNFYKSANINYTRAPKEFDEKRDEFELSVFSYARSKNIPVLAICRGMQLVNITLGGDIIQDIEESGKEDHRRHGEIDGMHEIVIAKDSLLYEINGSQKGIVNSAHHQALGTIALDLAITACSPDGIAEAVEWKNKDQKNFLLGIQWHPERLVQQQPDNPLTGNIRKKFLKIVENK